MWPRVSGGSTGAVHGPGNSSARSPARPAWARATAPGCTSCLARPVTARQPPADGRVRRRRPGHPLHPCPAEPGPHLGRPRSSPVAAAFPAVLASSDNAVGTSRATGRKAARRRAGSTRPTSRRGRSVLCTGFFARARYCACLCEKRRSAEEQAERWVTACMDSSTVINKDCSQNGPSVRGRSWRCQSHRPGRGGDGACRCSGECFCRTR